MRTRLQFIVVLLFVIPMAALADSTQTPGDDHQALLHDTCPQDVKTPTTVNKATTNKTVTKTTTNQSTTKTANQTIHDLNKLPCNSVLANLSVESLTSGAMSQLGPLAFVLLGGLRYDVQVRKVCASCDDVARYRTRENAKVFDSFCGSQVYGSGATYSGLVALPLAPVEDETLSEGEVERERDVLPGTLKTVIYSRHTQIGLTPTIEWEMNNGPDTATMTLLLIAARGHVILMPDYMGYGESTTQGIAKSYLIPNGYATSAVPLFWKVRDEVGREASCETNIGNGVMLFGYSEGGFATVAVADVLDKLGVNILSVRSGGGPILAGSKRITSLGTRAQAYPLKMRYAFALLGGAFSSTHSGLPNYQRGQDLLASEIRDELIDVSRESLTIEEVNAQVPGHDVFDAIFNPDFLAFTREMEEKGVPDPCNHLPVAELKSRNVDLLCEAFRMSDLDSVVRSARFPLEICHSVEDEVVPYIDPEEMDPIENPNISFRTVTGAHLMAFMSCSLPTVLYLLGGKFASIEIPKDDMCYATTIHEGSRAWGVDVDRSD